MMRRALAFAVLCALLPVSWCSSTFTVEIGGVFDENCGPSYAASAAAASAFVSNMNGGKGLRIGPSGDEGFFLKFNFSYALYPVNGYFDEGYHIAKDMYAKSHLIVGEGGGCNHYHGLNMTHIAGTTGKILMAPSGPSDFYKANYPSVFGMHLASESYPFATIQQFAFRGVKTAAMIYYGSGDQDGQVVDSLHDDEVRQIHNGIPGTNNLFTGGVINEGAINYCKQFGIKVLSVESYGDAYKDEGEFAGIIDGMLLRAAATKADVLIMSTLNTDGNLVINAMQSKTLAREHIFQGVWTTGVPWGGGSCHGTYYNCTNVAGATQEYNQNFQDPLFGARADYPDFIEENLAGSAISAEDANAWDFGPKGDVGAIISAYAQAFERAYQFRPIQDTSTFINDPQEYEYYRSSLAVWDGETVFGHVSFDAKRRNEGRVPTTVQMLANPSYDPEDASSTSHVAQLVFPLVDATAAFVHPSPGTQVCDDASITNFEIFTPYLEAKCTACPPGSNPLDVVDLDLKLEEVCEPIVVDRNFVSSGIKSLVLVMCGLNCAASVICVLWMQYRRKHFLVVLSQPTFLNTMCAGCVISSLSIVFMTYDEVATADQETLDLTTYDAVFVSAADGELATTDTDTLDLACMGAIWTYVLGFCLTFASLYAKTRRTNAVFNNPNLKVMKLPDRVLLQYIGLAVLFEASILLAFQLIDPLKWERECLEYDAIDPTFCIESRGQCESPSAWSFLAPIFTLHAVLLAHAVYICYRCRHIDANLTESKWISAAIFSDLQILLLGGALLYMVHDNPEIYTLVKAAIVFLNDGGDLWMIFLPKIINVEFYFSNLTEKQQKELRKRIVVAQIRSKHTWFMSGKEGAPDTVQSSSGIASSVLSSTNNSGLEESFRSSNSSTVVPTDSDSTTDGQ